MKKIFTLSIVLTLLVVAAICTNGCKQKKTVKVESGQVSSAESTSFKEVTSKLDTGGNLYLYLSTEQWLENLSENVAKWREIASSFPGLQDQQQQVTNGFDTVTRLIKDSGIEKVSGIGMSSIARASGFYYTKLVVHHYSGPADGFMWTMFGKEPHELTGLNLLPTNTAMAAFYDLDTVQTWEVVQKECEQSGFPQAADFLKTLPEQFQKNTGLKWSDVLESFGGEFGFVVTLDETRNVTLPLPTSEPFEIPEPAFMLVAKVKNDAIFNRIDESIKKNRQRGLISVDKDGLKIRTMPVPVPIRITLRPSVATSEGYLFFASNDALIKEALAVKGGKAGLKTTDEFKRLSTGVPLEGNQFIYSSERFGQTMMKVQRLTLEMNKQAPPEMKNLMQSFVQPDKAAFTFAVGANTDEGWLMVANGNKSGGALLAASAVAPAAIVAAIALPNFAKARETAQKNTCINNLRMIDGAKQQWALEKGKTSTDVPSWDDIQPYLGRGGGQTLRCPKGGEYTLGAIGQHPLCSIPGHALPQ